VQTGQGMIKDGNREDATLCWSIQTPSNQTRTLSIFGLIWLGVKVFLCGAHVGLRRGKSRAIRQGIVGYL
jgi:hypothetical protein